MKHICSNCCTPRVFLTFLCAVFSCVQIGKTGAWLLVVRLLHDHLRSSQGVTVENSPLPVSMFLHSLQTKSLTSSPSTAPDSINGNSPPQGAESNHTPSERCLVRATGSSLKRSQIVPLDHLQRLSSDDSKDGIKLSPVAVSPRDTPTQSSAESSSSVSVATGGGVVGGGSFESRHVISISVSPHMSYDFTHSCNECSKYVRGSALTLPDILTFSLPCSGAVGGGATGGERVVNIKWCVPAMQQKHCIIGSNRKTLERLKLPVMKVRGEKSPLLYPMTPVFTPTLGRDSAGLFNLFHNQYYHIHVLVTSESEFGKYCKAWPNHLVMALPDKEATGLGTCVGSLSLPPSLPLSSLSPSPSLSPSQPSLPPSPLSSCFSLIHREHVSLHQGVCTVQLAAEHGSTFRHLASLSCGVAPRGHHQ